MKEQDTEDKFCKHGSHTFICPECNPAFTDADMLKKIHINTPDTEHPDIILTQEQYDIIKEHASSEGFVTPDTEEKSVAGEEIQKNSAVYRANDGKIYKSLTYPNTFSEVVEYLLERKDALAMATKEDAKDVLTYQIGKALSSRDTYWKEKLQETYKKGDSDGYVRCLKYYFPEDYPPHYQ